MAPEDDEELAVEAMVVRERHETPVVHTAVVPFSQLVTGLLQLVMSGTEELTQLNLRRKIQRERERERKRGKERERKRERKRKKEREREGGRDREWETD